MNPFKCPLSGQVMTDPVLLKNDGISYERTFLEAHLRENPAFGGGYEDPFIPNTNLRSLIVNLRVIAPHVLTDTDLPPLGPNAR